MMRTGGHSPRKLVRRMQGPEQLQMQMALLVLVRMNRMKALLVERRMRSLVARKDSPLAGQELRMG